MHSMPASWLSILSPDLRSNHLTVPSSPQDRNVLGSPGVVSTSYVVPEWQLNRHLEQRGEGGGAEAAFNHLHNCGREQT